MKSKLITKICWLTILLSVVACNKEKNTASTVCPLKPATKRIPYNADVDHDISRIFGEPPIVGRLPENLSWSKDSTQVAYLRTSTSANGKHVKELWVYEVEDQRERPLFTDPKKPVSEYNWCSRDQLTILAGGDIFLLKTDGNTRQLTKTEPAEQGIKSSPDCTKIAFVRQHNLFVLDITTGMETQVTIGGALKMGFGEVTWIYEEEFDTEVGFEWAPNSERIWFYSMDTYNVNHKNIVMNKEGQTRQKAYPQPGEANPKTKVGVVDITADRIGLNWLDTGDLTDIYLPQVTWHPDSRHLIVARFDRLQTVLELLLCTFATGKCQPILEDRDPRWVNLLGKPRFIRDGKEFLWLSERDGFSHIYRIGIDGQVMGQITKGEWTVTSIDNVDEKQGLVYFTANPERPDAYGVYKISVSDDELELVSKEHGVHKVTFSPDGKYYLDTHSALSRTTRTDIYGLENEFSALVNRADLREYHGQPVMNDIFPIETPNGQTLMALLTRPQAIEPNRRYPVLIYVYGGPHAQVVLDAFRSMLQPWRNLMASRGILVFSVDGRGSGGRGHEFESAIHRRLGEVELEDQLAGVAYLKTLPFVDPDRLAIFGWSYGGTMVLNALLHTEGIFKAGVAVAPVTDWRQYDTAYTERYMQRPKDNPKSYVELSPLNFARNLKAPLLLVHGLADDNVLFANSALFMEALIDSGKNFDVMFYPEKNHDLQGQKTRSDLFSRITRFIEEHI